MFLQFFTALPLLMPKSEWLLFAQSHFFKEWQEQFALVALYKRATMSESLLSLRTKEQREQFALVHKQIAL